MNRIEEYPKSSPENSLYLSQSKRREKLSVSSITASRIIKESLEFKKQYTELNFFEKAMAIKIINSALDSFKDSINPFLPSNEQKEISEQFENLKNRTISQLHHTPRAQEVYQKIINLVLECVQAIQLENPLVKLQPNFALSKEDFQVAGLEDEDYVSFNRTVVCYDFTFYKLNEIDAFPFIFSNSPKWPRKFFLDPINFLSQWGYELVTTPSPGDLVVYCSNLDGYTQAKHWGIWTKNENVLSKKGAYDVFEHPITDVVLPYGNFTYFFHKKIKSPILKKFLEEVELATKSVSSFSHSSTRSPLSSKGSLYQMIQILETNPMKFIFKGSIYNQEYNTILKNKVVSKLREQYVKTSLKPEESKSQTLESIKKLVYDQSERVLAKI